MKNKINAVPAFNALNCRMFFSLFSVESFTKTDWPTLQIADNTAVIIEIITLDLSVVETSLHFYNFRVQNKLSSVLKLRNSLFHYDIFDMLSYRRTSKRYPNKA